MTSRIFAGVLACVLACVLAFWLVCGCSDGVQPSPPPAALDPANRDSMTIRLELMVDDVQRSVTFYTGVLGFVLVRSESGYAVVQAGKVELGLQDAKGLGSGHYFNPELQKSRRGLGAEIVLEVADVNGYYAAVEQAGYTTLSPLKVQSWGATDFRLADPDGYYLRVTSR